MQFHSFVVVDICASLKRKWKCKKNNLIECATSYLILLVKTPYIQNTTTKHNKHYNTYQRKDTQDHTTTHHPNNTNQVTKWKHTELWQITTKKSVLQRNLVPFHVKLFHEKQKSWKKTLFIEQNAPSNFLFNSK